MFVLYGNVSLIEIMILSVFFVVGTGLGAGKKYLEWDPASALSAFQVSVEE